jgi:sulfur carrier protein ThiS
MKLFIEKTGNNLEMKFNGKVSALLSQLKLNPETVLVVRNGVLVTGGDHIHDDDNVKIISVISGG